MKFELQNQQAMNRPRQRNPSLNFLARWLIYFRITKDHSTANTLSVVLAFILLIICFFSIINLGAGEEIDSKYYYDSNESSDDI